MTNWIDIIACILLTINTANGFYRGFLRSLSGPLCLLIGTLTGYSLFILTQNLGLSLLAAFLLYFLLNWLIAVMVRQNSDSGESPLTMLGRLGGSLFSFAWAAAFLTMILLSLGMLPLKTLGLTVLGKELYGSLSYRTAAQLFKNEKALHPALNTDCPNGQCPLSDSDKKDLANDQDIQSLIKDPRMQDILKDPSILQAVENNDIGKLLSNPVIKKLLKDPALLVKILKAYPKLKPVLDNEPQ